MDADSAHKAAQARVARAAQRLKDVQDDLRTAAADYRQAQKELGDVARRAEGLPVRQKPRASARRPDILRSLVLAILIGLGISAVLLPAVYFLVPGVRQQDPSTGGTP
jgi:anti-sigma factor RsiW